jgi:hypothetical protein
MERQWRAVVQILAQGPPPGTLRLNLECGHYLLYAVPAKVDIDVAGWMADLLINTARACGFCRMEHDSGSVPNAVIDQDITRKEPLR